MHDIIHSGQKTIIIKLINFQSLVLPPNVCYQETNKFIRFIFSLCSYTFGIYFLSLHTAAMWVFKSGKELHMACTANTDIIVKALSQPLILQLICGHLLSWAQLQPVQYTRLLNTTLPGHCTGLHRKYVPRPTEMYAQTSIHDFPWISEQFSLFPLWLAPTGMYLATVPGPKRPWLRPWAISPRGPHLAMFTCALIQPKLSPSNTIGDYLGLSFKYWPHVHWILHAQVFFKCSCNLIP